MDRPPLHADEFDREVRARLANLNSFLAESLGGIAVVQLFNRQDTEKEGFATLNTAYRDANLPVISWGPSKEREEIKKCIRLISQFRIGHDGCCSVTL